MTSNESVYFFIDLIRELLEMPLYFGMSGFIVNTVKLIKTGLFQLTVAIVICVACSPRISVLDNLLNLLCLLW